MPTKTPTPTILIVDDNEDAVAIVDRILTQHHFSTLRAYSGPECLQIVRHRAVDLIVTDVRMPGMDGFELIQYLRQLENTPPVIVLTARDDMVTHARAMARGVNEFVFNPVDPYAFIKLHRQVYSPCNFVYK